MNSKPYINLIVLRKIILNDVHSWARLWKIVLYIFKRSIKARKFSRNLWKKISKIFLFSSLRQSFFSSKIACRKNQKRDDCRGRPKDNWGEAGASNDDLYNPINGKKLLCFVLCEECERWPESKTLLVFSESEQEKKWHFWSALRASNN